MLLLLGVGGGGVFGGTGGGVGWGVGGVAEGGCGGRTISTTMPQTVLMVACRCKAAATLEEEEN